MLQNTSWVSPRTGKLDFPRGLGSVPGALPTLITVVDYLRIEENLGICVQI